MTPDLAFPRTTNDECRVTAIGHSTFLMQLGGLNILTDPVWSDRCSPVQWAGPRRRHRAGVALDSLPPIDIVLQSHDHYDHLDDATVRAIAHRHPDAVWCAPLGVAAQLRARGVQRTVAGRRIYFVGDSGSHPAFSEIGSRCGPCDLILMPVGAYEPRWFMRPVHMNPEEALDAFAALTAGHPNHPAVMVAMHWGTFTLTDEPADEPPRRTADGWTARGWDPERLWILAPGETRRLRSAR